jgi:transcriptional regulator with XRE-family HTH domain
VSVNSPGNQEDLVVEIRRVLRERRITLGWTQRDLADRLGVVQSWACELETGQNRRLCDITVGTLVRWTDALDVHLEVRITAGVVTARVRDEE